MTWINNAIKRTGVRTPARNAVLPLMREIEDALARGASQSAIYDALIDDGVKLNCSKSGFNAAIRYFRKHPELWSGQASSGGDGSASAPAADVKQLPDTIPSSSNDHDLFRDARPSEASSQKIWGGQS